MVIYDASSFRTIKIAFPIENLRQGASVSVNGACLTVTSFDREGVSFDVMKETLQKTTIGLLKEGDEINIERSTKIGEEIGGHLVSGHVSTTAEVISIDKTENNTTMTFRVDPAWMKFIFSKGFIALDGASLTVVDASEEQGTFQVWFIPETLRLTCFGARKVGDRVNVEIDPMTQVIVETVERILNKH